MKTTKYLLVLALLLSAGSIWAKSKARNVVVNNEAPVNIVVNRSPTCSCCAKWVEHLQQNNFKVEDIVTDDVRAIKDKHGVSKELASCHTALVNGYVVEGHVPAADIKKMLKAKPDITGITVPQMPSGTPGMEMGGRKDAYQVISFGKNSQPQVFSDYPAK
jgi:hypothetical protein